MYEEKYNHEHEILLYILDGCIHYSIGSSHSLVVQKHKMMASMVIDLPLKGVLQSIEGHGSWSSGWTGFSRRRS